MAATALPLGLASGSHFSSRQEDPSTDNGNEGEQSGPSQTV